MVAASVMDSSVAADSSNSISLAANPLAQAQDIVLLNDRRNEALEALELTLEKSNVMAGELDGFGWTTDLARNTPRPKVVGYDKREFWAEKDKRALLCLKRFVLPDLKDEVILQHFFPTRNLNQFRNQFMQLKDPKKGPTWDSTDDVKLVRLYQKERMSFEIIAQDHFPDLPAFDLEKVYGRLQNPRKNKTKGFNGKGKGKEKHDKVGSRAGSGRRKVGSELIAAAEDVADAEGGDQEYEEEDDEDEEDPVEDNDSDDELMAQSHQCHCEGPANECESACGSAAHGVIFEVGPTRYQVE
ncbi:hypothetical protein EK21DRAFT_87228 [Setomelanomma holmii]|uniref:Uncharacterized protein n=1 Tax=Setomelanomma holmii TaxID=210430 RepID=A0A9P4HD10_9PLEO|nr:hypothetical protein EK21DRAFT_87228 [Setomelanomma holmii]